MKKREVLSLIYDGLGPVFADTYFRLNKTEQAFVRKIPEGRQLLVVPLTDYQPEFRFSLVACIRIDAVETILHDYLGSAPKYRSMSDTTITQLEYFTGHQRSEFIVYTEEDVASALDEIAPVVRDRIVPFFDQYVDAPSLDKAVNSDEAAQRCLDRTHPPWGPAHRVALAHVVGNPDFEKLVDKYRTQMADAGCSLDEFDGVVDFMRSH